jgi:multiple sugar transport system ATP-binding protein
MEGTLGGGAFTGENVRIEGLRGPDGAVTLGFRAEDAAVAPQGAIRAPVYTMELLGDATMVTLRAGGALVAVKADKAFRAEIGQEVAIAVPPVACHLFDSQSGDRLPA